MVKLKIKKDNALITILDESDVESVLNEKLDISDAFSGSYNDLTNKPTIPSASSSNPSADINGGAIGSSSNYAKADHQHPLSSAYATSEHNQASSTITNATAFNNIKSGESTTLTLDTQAKINSAINDKLGVLEGLKFVEITTDKGTASASTMNKLYIENKNSKTDIYYTKQSGSSYSWVKLEDNILEDISIPVVYDGLDSDDSTKVLSAKQGKVLNTDKISKVANNTNVLLADGTNIAQSTFSASGHTHNYTTTADVDTEIEAYLDAITTALTS